MDLIELVGCDELQYLGADVAARSSGQDFADVHVRWRRNVRKLARYEVAQSVLGDVRSCFDKGVKIVSGAAIIELHDRGIAHLRMLFQARGDAGAVVGKLRAAAFAIDIPEDAVHDQLVGRLRSEHPERGQTGFARAHAPLGGGEFLDKIAVLVLEQMPQILVRQQSKQAGAPREAGSELKVHEIGAAVTTAQPVLLLGEIVVANTCPVQGAQRGLGRGEKSAVAIRLCSLQRDSVDPAANDDPPAGEEERRSNAKLAGNGERPALACEQMVCDAEGPPRDLVDPAHDRLDLARGGRKRASLHRGEKIALEHHARRPLARELARYGQRLHSAASAKLPAIQRSRSASARLASWRFFASVFAVPRRRSPLSPLGVPAASGGNSPKLMFIG